MRFSLITVASALAMAGSVSAFATVGSGRLTAFATSSTLHAVPKSRFQKNLEAEKKLAEEKAAAETAAAEKAAAEKAAAELLAKKELEAKEAARKAEEAVKAADGTTEAANKLPAGIALGAIPLVVAPLVLLSAGRESLTKTKARRDELYEQIEKFEKAQKEAKNRKVNTSVDFGGLFQAAVRIDFDKNTSFQKFLNLCLSYFVIL